MRALQQLQRDVMKWCSKMSALQANCVQGHNRPTGHICVTMSASGFRVQALLL